MVIDGVDEIHDGCKHAYRAECSPMRLGRRDSIYTWMYIAQAYVFLKRKPLFYPIATSGDFIFLTVTRTSFLFVLLFTLC